MAYKKLSCFRFGLFVFCFLIIVDPSVFAATVFYTGPGNTSSTTETTPIPSNPNLPGPVSQANLNTAYTQLFGGPSPNSLPNIGWLESPTIGVLLLEGGKSVDTFQNFEFTVTGDYWTVKTNIEFNPQTAPIFDPNDHIVLSGFVQHTGKLSQNDIPHEADAAAGPQIPYTLDLNAGTKLPRDIFGPAAGLGQGALAHHPNNIDHFDFQQSAIFARVNSASGAGIDFLDDITSWTAVVGAQHLNVPTAPVPEPSTILLFGGGIAGVFLRRRKLNP